VTFRHAADIVVSEEMIPSGYVGGYTIIIPEDKLSVLLGDAGVTQLVPGVEVEIADGLAKIKVPSQEV